MGDPNYYNYEGKIYYELPARFKWSLTHLDGPMTAIVSYQGRTYYAKCHQSPETRQERYFWMYPLTPIENLKEIAYQEWFRKYFGWHCDFGDDNQRIHKTKTWKEKWWNRFFPEKKVQTTMGYIEKQKELKIDRTEYTRKEAVGYCTLYSWQEHQFNIRYKS